VIALDTNVIIRLVMADDPEQLEIARRLFQSDDLWIAKTVLLETEWVLRFTYKLERHFFREILWRLMGYRRLQIEDRGAVLRALHLYEDGLDFADALHVVSSGAADRFVTFDKELAKAAQWEEGLLVELLSANSRV
jgi:predicted nucleic-acid-binding protein